MSFSAVNGRLTGLPLGSENIGANPLFQGRHWGDDRSGETP
jgi:hypothetical protein